MSARRAALVLAVVGLSLLLAGCRRTTPAPAVRSETSGPQALRSYRWTTELRADSSLFDQSQAPEALRSSAFVLRASVTGDRVLPDRERSRTVVLPVSIGTRESVTIGTQRWNRVGDGPWRVGEEAFPAARAYFGGTATLSARGILEPAETSQIARLRTEIASMPYREETLVTGASRHYTLRPDQVALVVGDASLNPFPVLNTLPSVRIDLWVDQAHQVLVGLRVTADGASVSDVFLLDVRVTEIEPAGLTIDPPR